MSISLFRIHCYLSLEPPVVANGLLVKLGRAPIHKIICKYHSPRKSQIQIQNHKKNATLFSVCCFLSSLSLAACIFGRFVNACISLTSILDPKGELQEIMKSMEKQGLEKPPTLKKVIAGDGAGGAELGGNGEDVEEEAAIRGRVRNGPCRSTGSHSTVSTGSGPGSCCVGMRAPSKGSAIAGVSVCCRCSRLERQRMSRRVI